MAVDRLSMQFYSSLHPRGPHVQGIQFYLGNPGFLEDCNDYHFLDFIELIFKWQRLWDSNINPHELLKNVNEFLEVDDLPYYLTEFVFQSSTQIETYPQIIRRDNEAIHETAIQPALTLLANPAFASANKEFLEALGHYRKGEHADCLAKCGSSFGECDEDNM